MSALFGGGGGKVQQVNPAVYSQGGNPAPYIPTGQAGLDQELQQLISGIGGSSNAVMNTYLPGVMSVGNEALTNANLVSGLAPQFTGLASSYLNPPGTSPVYQEMSNLVGQQANAANAASGVQGPYAASNINQAQTQLGLDWQQRMPGLAASLAGTGLTLGGAPQATLSNTLSNLGGTLGLPQATVADILAYLGHGLQASNLAGALGGAGFGQNQQQLGDIGSLLGGGGLGLLGVGGALNVGGLGGGGGAFSTLGDLFSGGTPVAFGAGDPAIAQSIAGSGGGLEDIFGAIGTGIGSIF